MLTTQTIDEEKAIILAADEIQERRYSDATGNSTIVRVTGFVDSGDPDYPTKKVAVRMTLREYVSQVRSVLGSTAGSDERLVEIVHQESRRCADSLRRLIFRLKENGRVRVTTDSRRAMTRDEMGG